MISVLALVVSAIAQNDKSTSLPKSVEFKPTLKLKNFGQINNNYFRGARPADQDYQSLAAMGVKTIINLERKGDQEAQQKAEAAGLKFIRIGMSDSDSPNDADVQKFLSLANDPANQPIYVHCKGGRHRTGLVTAVYRIEHDGWTADQAYEEMKQFDFGYGFGHGDLKDYVYNYYSHKEQQNAVGHSATTGNPK
ncbi:MAG: dual specificity protein phosphatase family protein [Acidobacteriota bacterium]